MVYGENSTGGKQFVRTRFYFYYSLDNQYEKTNGDDVTLIVTKCTHVRHAAAERPYCIVYFIALSTNLVVRQRFVHEHYNTIKLYTRHTEELPLGVVIFRLLINRRVAKFTQREIDRNIFMRSADWRRSGQRFGDHPFGLF